LYNSKNLKIRNENKKKVEAKKIHVFCRKKTLLDLPNKKIAKSKTIKMKKNYRRLCT
jgi:hypothetical protein